MIKEQVAGEPKSSADPEKSLILAYLNECPVCGYSPPPDLTKPDPTKAWLAFPSPLPGMWFIICPLCHSVHVNPNFLENMAKYKEMKTEKRIITGDDRIVVPGR